MKKLIILSLSALLLLLPISLQSQEPPPAPFEISKPKQDKPAKENHNREGKQYNTNDLPAAVKKIEAVSPTHEKKDQAKTNDEGSTKAGFGYYSDFLLVLFNGILAVFTCLLWWSTKKMWEATKDTANTAKEGVELNKQEFIATHRPRLRVHSIFLIHETIPKVSINPKPWEIQCTIDNIGESPAIIKKCKMAFTKLKNPLPAIPFFSDEEPLIKDPFIKSGESTTGSIRQFNKETISAVLYYETASAGGSQGRNANDLYFFGYIDYLDVLGSTIGNTRRIAFCRRYDVKTERFAKVEDEDYEYSY